MITGERIAATDAIVAREAEARALIDRLYPVNADLLQDELGVLMNLTGIESLETFVPAQKGKIVTLFRSLFHSCRVNALHGMGQPNERLFYLPLHLALTRTLWQAVLKNEDIDKTDALIVSLPPQADKGQQTLILRFGLEEELRLLHQAEVAEAGKALEWAEKIVRAGLPPAAVATSREANPELAVLRASMSEELEQIHGPIERAGKLAVALRNLQDARDEAIGLSAIY